MEATLETPWTGGATPGATPFAAHQLFDERSSVWADVELECRILNKNFGVAGRSILPRPDEMTICMPFLLKKNFALRALSLMTSQTLFPGSATACMTGPSSR
ncbi:uncharacterized protein LOC126597628 [Malus sylvestris]|uniref:uncharacterized protein LOC126597628 n=1 Tax=Malus sylvestris TaxID=3752 RepID=UPI0021AD10EB|nr:uncharacterized protein LOC126597628 [Malus sylvestris]